MTIDYDGAAGGLAYLDSPAVDLDRDGRNVCVQPADTDDPTPIELATRQSFEEVAWSRWQTALGNGHIDSCLPEAIRRGAELPPTLLRVLRHIPGTADPIEVLRTTCSVVSQLPEQADQDDGTRALQLLATLPTALVVWDRIHHGGRHGPPPQRSHNACHLGIAATVLETLTGQRPSGLAAAALDTCLVMQSHMAGDTSHAAARRVAAKGRSLFDGVRAALDTARQTGEGSDCKASVQFVEQFATDPSARLAFARSLRDRTPIPGFSRDTTAATEVSVLRQLERHLATERPHRLPHALARSIEQVARELGLQLPTPAFHLGMILRHLGVSSHLMPALLLCARSVGWIETVFAQQNQPVVLQPSRTPPGRSPRPRTRVLTGLRKSRFDR